MLNFFSSSARKKLARRRFTVDKTDAEWAKELDPFVYQVTRRHKTEPAFTGELLNNKEKGRYLCRCCGQALFTSEKKYDSGTGWPSFFDALPAAVESQVDQSFGMSRVEVHCSNCGAHLGHSFPDGPKPTGTRYCINSVALRFRK